MREFWFKRLNELNIINCAYYSKGEALVSRVGEEVNSGKAFRQ